MSQKWPAHCHSSIWPDCTDHTRTTAAVRLARREWRSASAAIVISYNVDFDNLQPRPITYLDATTYDSRKKQIDGATPLVKRSPPFE